MKRVFVYVLANVLWLSACKKEDNTPANITKYFPKVKAIVAANCLSCHNSADQFNWQGRPIALDGDDNLVKQSATIKASVADPIIPTNKRMPLTGGLTQQQINDIVSWYNKGGKVSD